VTVERRNTTHFYIYETDDAHDTNKSETQLVLRGLSRYIRHIA